MKMTWNGAKDLQPMGKVMAETLRVAAARSMMESGKRQRDRALENFGRFGIRMITGRSRSLYAITPMTSMFTPGTSVSMMAIEVGYTKWPKRDSFSPDEDIPFYPAYLNYGTPKMPARPYHTAAVEATEPEFYRDMDAAMDEAFKKAAMAFGSALV